MQNIIINVREGVAQVEFMRTISGNVKFRMQIILPVVQVGVAVMKCLCAFPKLISVSFHKARKI